MSHLLLVTTALDSANTELSQKVLLDNASRATGLWVVVLGAGSRPLQLPENRAGPGEASQGSDSWQTHQGSRSLSLSWSSLLVQGFGFNLWNLTECLSHAPWTRIQGQEEVCIQRQAAGQCLTYMLACRTRKPGLQVLAHPPGVSGPG